MTQPTESTPDTPDLATTLDPDEQTASPNAEAAKYRHRAKEAEAARDAAIATRDALSERVTQFERRHVESLATGLSTASDLWMTGVELDDLRNDDGEIDPEKVTAAVGQVLVDRPHWAARRMPAPVPNQGPQPNSPQGATWSDVLRGS